jgi:hypothetical protein
MKTGEIEKIASRMPKTASRAINNIGKIQTKPCPQVSSEQRLHTWLSAQVQIFGLTNHRFLFRHNGYRKSDQFA